MRISVVEIRDAVWRSQRRMQMASLGKCFTGVSPLIRAHMRMVFQVYCQAFLKLCGKRLAHLALIACLETWKET